MADDKKPSEVLGGWNRQVAEQLGQIADNTGGEGTAQAGSEKRPSDVLGGWYKEVSDLLDDIATNTEGGGAEPYVLPTMSPTTKGGATVGEGLTMDGTALSVDFTEVASVDALEEATALSPTGGIVSTQDGLAVSPTQQTEGAIDGALLELTAKSKPATQASTTGKNLLPRFEEKTVNGITLSYDNTECVILNGTSTAVTIISYFFQQVLSSGTYTISANNVTTINDNDTFLRARDSNGVINASIASLKSPDAFATFTASSGITQVDIRISSGITVTNFALYIQLELGSTATPYEPYSGGAPSPSPDYPQPIVTVRGRNLINPNAIATHSPEYYRANDDGSITALKKDNRAWDNCATVTLDAGTYTIWQDGFTMLQLRNMTDSVQVGVYMPRHHATFTLQSQKVIAINISYYNTTFPVTGCIQLTLGSTPQPYVPYGHVGLERRDSQGNLLDTTPIPLPSRGWVAGLPDGTADELTVDGAGKVVWDCNTDETTTAATDGITGTVGVDVMSTTGQIADGATVLYKHSTTKTCGYIDLPSMQDCVLSIPELDALGVRYTIGDGAEIARQWYARAHSEYEQRITDLEEAVAELTAGA